MKNVKILIDMPSEENKLAELRTVPGLDIVMAPEPREDVRPLPEALIRDCEMFFTTCLPANHEQMSGLRVVQIASVGYSQLFDHRLNERGIRACNAMGVQDIPIAEWNIAMMINLKRDMRTMMKNQTDRIWDRDIRFQREINGSTLGIWGYGGIGRQTARLAKALGLKIHVMTLDGKLETRGNCYSVPGAGDAEGVFPERFFSLEQKKDFLGGLDFLVITIPLTPKTKGIIGEAELNMLPRHAFILNPARGPLIQEEALVRALREKRIAGAALDTHYYYPMPPEHPLWSMDNVIMTPHISGSSGSTRFLDRIWDIWVQNVKRYINDETLLNELSPAQINGQ